MHKLAIFGSTGSIGTQSLHVIADNPEHFAVFALVANKNVDALIEQCATVQPEVAAIADQDKAQDLAAQLASVSPNTKVLAGEEAIAQLAGDGGFDIAIAAITGQAGLPSTWQAVAAGKTVLLANKESLVMAGQLLTEKARQTGAVMIPVDSEHSAVQQCLDGVDGSNGLNSSGENTLDSIVLTASGGPFLERDVASLVTVTPEEACAHPKWDMGPKISVDSATLMNKGLEVIEAHWLFSLPPARIEVLIHPQSLVHAIVRLRNQSALAQMATTDMRIPISYALSRCATPPIAVESRAPALSLAQLAELRFAPVDEAKFPCLKLAYQALEAGGSASLVLNVANELAVEAFLQNRIKFTDIYAISHQALDEHADVRADSIDDIFQVAGAIQSRLCESSALGQHPDAPAMRASSGL